jgi:uncharacterized repeat protein (TIGR03803 family)
MADAAGNLFGTTSNGDPSDNGTVFEITNSGFVTGQVFAGRPGTASCYGNSVLALLHEDRNLDVAAESLGLGNAEALQDAIQNYCSRFRRLGARG